MNAIDNIEAVRLDVNVQEELNHMPVGYAVTYIFGAICPARATGRKATRSRTSRPTATTI